MPDHVALIPPACPVPCLPARGTGTSCCSLVAVACPHGATPAPRLLRDRGPRHPCRTAPLLLGSLLLAVTGCVTVPSPPPGPALPPALAPAADRSPAPLRSEWPTPTQGVPREELSAIDPSPGSPTPNTPPGRSNQDHGAPAAEHPARRAPAAQHRSSRRQAPPSSRPSKKPHTTTKAKTPKTTVKPRPTAPAADMRELCREAERIRLPYGVPALCRSSYGR